MDYNWVIRRFKGIREDTFVLEGREREERRCFLYVVKEEFDGVNIEIV